MSSTTPTRILILGGAFGGMSPRSVVVESAGACVPNPAMGTIWNWWRAVSEGSGRDGA